MIKDFFKNYVYPISTLSGSIIGVGFLSLPYIALKAGIWVTLFYFVVLTTLIIFLHTILGEISLKTPDFKRWPGFVGFYFGTWAKRAILLPMIIGSFGVLLAYLIVGGQFLTAIFSPIVGGSLSLYVLLYALVLSLAIYVGVRAISRIEFWAIILLLVSIVFIYIKGMGHMSLGNIFFPAANFQMQPSGIPASLANIFLPYGAIMFSLWGTALIPEVEEMVAGRKASLKKIIIISTLIPAVIYLLFVLLVLSITGSQTTESALVGVKNVLGDGITSVILFVGIITTFAAFVAHGLFLKKVFMYDLKMKEFVSWTLVCFVPIALFLAGFNSFISLISFVGGVLLSIDGILILLMYKKIGGKKAIVYPLILVFILGIIYSLVYSIR